MVSPPIDLLYCSPVTRVSLPLIQRALVFAFSAGDTAGAFERVLENAGCGDSTFSPECFAGDLFVDQFIERCLPIRIGNTSYTPCKPYLRRALTQPPKDQSDTHFRQDILAELRDRPQHRQTFERLYVELQDLRTLLSSGDYSTRMDQNARRLDILRAVSTIFRCMESGFEGAASGLSRIRNAGRSIVSSPGYKRLAELLEYEGHHATVDLRVRLGLQGNVRAFAVVNYQENVDSALHTSWLKELWHRLRMLLRGYRVTQHEMLSRLLDQTFEDVKKDVLPLFQLLGDMEFYLAGLGFIDMAHKAGLEPTFPELVSRGNGELSLRGLYNPFLLADGVDVRPCDVSAEADAIVIITGPNSGGKTRLLQSVALAQLLSQCGLMIPASEGRVVWTEGMFVSLLNEVSADQREGRLGMELLRIRRLFEQINVGDMVVIDELCSGTNPSEGEEIFRLVIGLLGELHPQVWLTTHFLNFAQRLKDSSELQQLRFLQVKLDAHELPTFQFEEGVANTSLARQTAARLGVTWDELAALVERAQVRSQSQTSDRQLPERRIAIEGCADAGDAAVTNAAAGDTTTSDAAVGDAAALTQDRSLVRT